MSRTSVSPFRLTPFLRFMVVVCSDWLVPVSFCCNGDFAGGSPAVALACCAGVSATCTFEHDSFSLWGCRGRA